MARRGQKMYGSVLRWSTGATDAVIHHEHQRSCKLRLQAGWCGAKLLGMFVDKVSVTFRAGNGGNGIVSFRREKFRQFGGPDGGNGGNGGDIILQASRNQNTLATFRYKKLVKAQDGANGARSKKHGKSGQDVVVDVPVGTVVLDSKNKVLIDLAKDGQIGVIAKGGKGGYGNAHFTSSTRQAPRVFEKGDPGEAIEAVLELKMLADVGIIGMPNAGKSTLLSVISNAKPEIADYPFTTLHPNLGVVDIDKKQSLLFADIPGLIEGASQGRGLGDEFLRHIERTSVLVHLIDVYSDNLELAHKTIIKELRDYKIDLSGRPQIIALTKTDGVEDKRVNQALKTLKKLAPRGTSVLAISSSSGTGVKELLREVQKKVLADVRRKTVKSSRPTLPVITLGEDDTAWNIEKRNDTFVVTGKKIERFAHRTDFNDFHGQQRLRDIMHKMGILAELRRRGIKPGQTVAIGKPTIGHLEY